MRPGEIIPGTGPVPLNPGRPRVRLIVCNVADRPVQVGSHHHFAESNRALRFDRMAAYGQRLDIPAGTAARFEPGESRQVRLVPFGGRRWMVGFNGLVGGGLDDAGAKERFAARLREANFQMGDGE